jgi:hypothetical protein
VKLTRVKPPSGDRGDRFPAEILGDAFGDALNPADHCSFGSGIEVTNFKVVDDGKISFKLSILINAVLGRRDVTVTNSAGKPETLYGGFIVT